MSPRFETAGSGTPEPEGSRSPAPPQRLDPDFSKLEQKLSSLSSAVSHWERELESSGSRSTRLEGAFTVLLSSLEAWKSDIREVAGRTESRVLRGLEVLDSRISKVQPSGPTLNQSEILSAITKLETAIGERIATLERDVSGIRKAAAAPSGLETLDQRLQSIQDKVHSSDTELAGRLGATFEILEKRLSSIEKRIVTPDAQSTRIEGSIEALARRLQTIEQRVSAPNTDVTDRIGKSFEALQTRLQAIETKVSTPDTDVPDRIGKSFDALQTRLQAIEVKVSTPDTQLPMRIGKSFEAVDARLQSIEEKIATPVTAVPEEITSSFEALQQRLGDIEQKVSEPDKEMPGRLASSMEVLERRLTAIDQRLATPDTKLPERLGKGLELLESRLNAIDERLAAPDPLPDRISGNFEALERHLRVVDQKVSTPDTELQERISENFRLLEQRLNAMEETLSTPDTEVPAGIAQTLSSLEKKLSDGQAALTSKLETVLAEGDENSATQLRYLGSLEELQASVAKRLHALEAIVKNPLDAQQWERLAKGLEFLDVRLAQSLDSVSSKLDTAISSLTTTLDARAASGQEANIKSAERLWRALRGLEDQITGSYQLVRQSQERLEAASVNVANALEELRAVHGARASHTEKFVMEGLENLDSRFAQNLLAVSDRLGAAIFGLNKATEEWRSDLANSSEEAEERLTTRLSQAETNLIHSLKSGLEALGRREERMLALILGGGPAVMPTPPEETPKTPE